MNNDKISLNHCFDCNKGFSTPQGLQKHFLTQKHNENAFTVVNHMDENANEKLENMEF